MNTKRKSNGARSLRVLASLALAVGLLILGLALLVSQARAQTGSISGTVDYYGGAPAGTYQINVDVLTDTSKPPVFGINLAGPGTYTIDGLDDDSYFVCANVDPGAGYSSPNICYDANHDGEPDPVIVEGGGAVSGIDIALGGPWRPLGGPAVAGGQVGALAVHPAVSGTLYTAVQPPNADWYLPSIIHRSTDGAATWTAIYTAPIRIRALAMTGTLVYAGAYNGDTSSPHPLIYRSGDGGVSWTAPLSVAEGVIWQIDVHPSVTQTAVAGGGDFPDDAVLYRTTDAGATWTKVFSYSLAGWYPTVNAVLIHPTTPLNWLFSHDGEVDGTYGAYIYRSTDGGVTWTDVFSITDDAIASLVANPVTPTTIYAATSNGNFYRSADTGATWAAVTTDGSAGRSLVLDPPDTLYALSGNDVRQSTDEGETWIPVGQVPGPGDAGGLVIDLGPTPGALYAGGSVRGVHKSTDGGVNWEERNDGIESLVLPRDINVDPQDLARMFVAADCGGGWMTSDGGGGWTQLHELPSCMGCFAVNPGAPDVVYAGAYDCGGASIFRSGDGGLTFEPVYTATFIVSDCSGGDEAILALAVSPAMTGTVYATGVDQPDWQDGRAVVVHSADDGASWTPVFTLPARSQLESLAVDPADHEVAYVGGEDCSGPECVGVVYRTGDGGGQWTLVFTATDTVVRSIVVDHLDTNIVYVADDGYRAYKSIDGGGHWTTVRRPPWEMGDVSGNLLAIDTSLPTHVYLGGWGYAGETSDGGETWSGMDGPINHGIPQMAPTALAVDNGTMTQTLYAGFSGVWAYSRLAPQPFRIYLPLVMRIF